MIPPLRLYSFIADGERGAVIGPSGDMAWMCLPGWDGESVFSSLLGGRGVYSVTPESPFVWGGYYEDGGLIWRSRWVLQGGDILECREALAFPGEPKRALLLRRLSVEKGEVRVKVNLDLRPSFGRRGLRNIKKSGEGAWSAQAEGLYFRWTGGGKARFQEENGWVLELTVGRGQEHDFLLELSSANFSGPAPEAARLWKATERSWRKSVPRFEGIPAEREARHAYAVLRGLTASSGGMAAAATTSLPERADAGRNYDYRYCWIRDQCWAGQAVGAAGPFPLLRDSLRFIRRRILEDGVLLRPVYSPGGAKVPEEKELKHLPGYPGAPRVVIGNRAGEQFQLDSFGEILLLLSAGADHDLLDGEDWKAAEAAGTAIEMRWKEKDAGLWELKPRYWTHSRLICAAGLRRIAGRAPRPLRSRWLELAKVIVEDTAAKAVNSSGRWQRAADDRRLDASLLLSPLRGGTNMREPRSLATLRGIELELTQDEYCYRFPISRPLGEAEGAFAVCGYWMCLTYLQLGRKVEAFRWFERARASCGPPGLYTEEFDVRQRELRGNFPQAFVHALMLESAVRLGQEPNFHG